MTEEWRPVVGYEGTYEVSNQGRVRSVDRIVEFADGHSRRYRGRVIKQSVNGGGYPVLGLWRGGRGEGARVHRLVLAAFVGPCPEGEEVRHRNRIKTDVRLANLEYGTRAENEVDKITHGTHQEARKARCAAGHSYLDPANVIIKRTRRGGIRRICRTCKRTWGRDYMRRKRTEAAT